MQISAVSRNATFDVESQPLLWLKMMRLKQARVNVSVAPSSWNANQGNGVGLCRDVGSCQSATNDDRSPVRGSARRKEVSRSP